MRHFTFDAPLPDVEARVVAMVVVVLFAPHVGADLQCKHVEVVLRSGAEDAATVAFDVAVLGDHAHPRAVERRARLQVVAVA